MLRIRVDNAAAPGAAPVSDPSRRGHGLVGMRERAASVGGTLTAGPSPDGGFAVRADLPIAAGTEEGAS
jgi:signal transduction histidine kinase